MTFSRFSDHFSRYGPASVDLVKHTVDVVQSLVVMSRSNPFSAESLAVCRFILSRCFVEVRARLDAARSLLDFHGSMTLVRVLRGWSPRPEDASMYRGAWEIVRDPYLAYELQQQRIPTREHSGETHFHFGVDTASSWMKTLCKSIENLQDSIGRYASNDPSGPHLTMMAKSMRILAHLLNTSPIRKIFDSRSLQSQLELLRKRRSHYSARREPTSPNLNIIGETS